MEKKQVAAEKRLKEDLSNLCEISPTIGAAAAAPLAYANVRQKVLSFYMERGSQVFLHGNARDLVIAFKVRWVVVLSPICSMTKLTTQELVGRDMLDLQGKELHPAHICGLTTHALTGLSHPGDCGCSTPSRHMCVIRFPPVQPTTAGRRGRPRWFLRCVSSRT